MTRSPSAIMRVVVNALPTAPRSWAGQTLQGAGGFVGGAHGLKHNSAAAACIGRSGEFKGLQAAALLGARFEILRLDITNERGGRQGLAGRTLQQILHEYLRAEAMDVGAQPVEQAGELAAGELLIQRRELRAQALVQLGGDDRAQRVRREVAERADSPVDVLQAALQVVRRSDSQTAAPCRRSRPPAGPALRARRSTAASRVRSEA